MDMRIKDPDPAKKFKVQSLVYFIIGMTIALLVLSATLPTIVNAFIPSAFANNTIVQVFVGLISVVFVAVILLYMLGLL